MPAATTFFATVPEWVVFADISAQAVRLYAVLDRYADRTNQCWPSRSTIANLMGCSNKTVDRAKDELVTLGALTYQNRRSDAGDPTSNLYVLRRDPPKGVGTPAPHLGTPAHEGGDKDGPTVGTPVSHEPEPLEPENQNSSATPDEFKTNGDRRPPSYCPPDVRAKAIKALGLVDALEDTP